MKPETIAAIANAWLDHESRTAVERIDRIAKWDDAFPRPLEETAPLLPDVMVVPIANLGTSAADAWFLSRGREQRFAMANRPLHGCMLGIGDFGFIFVDANDPPDQRQYTIGHELGHFLLDHLFPRQRAVNALGAAIREVMDGKRPATITERFKAALTGIPIGQHVNLMERNTGAANAMDLYQSEYRADRIALALLAPPGEVLARADDRGNHAERHVAMVELLVGAFGLPRRIAGDYATALLTRINATSTPYNKLVRA